jgi:hypothetical protein
MNSDLLINRSEHVEISCAAILNRTTITDCPYTGVGQNNGNTTDTVHISLLIWCWTTFAFSTAAILLRMDSYKFWQSLVEFYTVLLEEYLQVALEKLTVGICSSL